MRTGKLYNVDFSGNVEAELKTVAEQYKAAVGTYPTVIMINPVHLSPSVPSEIFLAGGVLRVIPIGNIMPGLAWVGKE